MQPLVRKGGTATPKSSARYWRSSPDRPVADW